MPWGMTKKGPWRYVYQALYYIYIVLHYIPSLVIMLHYIILYSTILHFNVLSFMYVKHPCRSVRQLYLTLYSIAGHCVILQNRYEEGDVAWDIIKKGPERLQSQFAAGYGMVLNLLHSRSLDEAKAFIDRSFNSYLSKILQLAYSCICQLVPK